MKTAERVHPPPQSGVEFIVVGQDDYIVFTPISSPAPKFLFQFTHRHWLKMMVGASLGKTFRPGFPGKRGMPWERFFSRRGGARRRGSFAPLLPGDFSVGRYYREEV